MHNSINRSLFARAKTLTNGEWSDLYRAYLGGTPNPVYTDSRSGKTKGFSRAEVSLLEQRLGTPRQQVGA